jgi:transcriptional regulator with XRE-family HTH domain
MVARFRTLAQVLEDEQITANELAQEAGLETSRVEAIAEGRWTPSPLERKKIAEVLGLDVEHVVWGHTLDPRNIRYRQYGLKENF